MNDKEKKEFKEAMEFHKNTIHLLKLTYLAAQMKEHELDAMFKDIQNEVLAENSFYVSNYSLAERLGYSLGDRILKDRHTILMSKSDFEEYLKLSTQKMFGRGYTDEEGNYNEGYNGMLIKLEAESKLVNFVISIFPESLKEAFKMLEKNYSMKKTFIDLLMGGNDK